MWRNERHLYKRKCEKTGKEIIAIYSPESPWKVYASDIWWEDEWNPLEYGKDIDLSGSVFKQINNICLKVPHLALIASPDTHDNNSDYVNFAGWNKNSYLIFDSDFNEDTLYSNVLKHSKDCMDCSYLHSSQLCYECVDCFNCYELRFSQDCTNCHSSAFLRSCIGCKSCFFCSNLANKEYCFHNEQLSKQDFEARMKKIDLESHNKVRKLQEEFHQYTQKFPRKYCSILQCENCTGDYITNAKNCFRCFNIADGEDLYYCDSLYNAKTCVDVSSFGENIQRIYNCATIGHNSFNILFCYSCVMSTSDLLYCIGCRQSKHCFGCVCLKQAEYCIFNKQYTKEEYENLVPQLIEHMQNNGEWGEFFPASMSPFAYNETVANEYFPLSKSEVLQKGWKWRDENDDLPQVERVIPASKLPEKITDIPDDILNWAVKCEVTDRPFRVVVQELDLYRRMNLPVPHLHPDERHRMRILQRNPRKLWSRQCAKCNKDIWTSYAPDGSATVYCEECYLSSVY
ncbi:MAG: hypothetical protein QF793_00860 [Candidatus Peribacteraceae bacterium]|nr:hypothetical protein [bacterium]MDP6561456.1 hypothetical protein [Candidatus Peribacteraceae bacterium]|tara:strand:- start:21360 stop:22901 length:1542 start_codon:yes stop_codon:yes gene_type:complete